MPIQMILWIVFGVVILAMLAMDIGIFQRSRREVKFKEALVRSAVWIGLAFLFDAGIYCTRGHDSALKFLTGYLLEESLSVDNLFVFLLIFSYFQVPSHYQHKVLFWGILGAVLMRALFIATGITLIHQFYWLMYVFGALLILTGIKLAFEKDKEIHPEKNFVLKLFKRFMPVTAAYEKDRFFVKKEKRYFATPLLVVLLVIETTDILFALDSIPAILAITTDPFIVYTSNIFAILGLRSLYFALAGMMQLFHHLHYGLAIILVFVGFKMLMAEIFKIPIAAALGVIALVLVFSIVASLIWPSRSETN